MPGRIIRARHLLDRRVVVPVMVGLALLVGYQVWAWRSHADAVATTAKVNATAKTRTASTCPQVARLYGTLLQLMQNDATFSPQQIAAMQAQGIDRVAACKAAPS